MDTLCTTHFKMITTKPQIEQSQITGVRIIGPIGIGEVQMTTIFKRKKSEKKWFSFGDWMGI